MVLPREPGDPPDAAPQPSAAGPASIRSYDVGALLGENRELILRHEGSEYRLRVTAKGKLILTK